MEKHREDPDFCLYYISDEPECRHVSPVYLKHIYDFVSELDPYHPVFTCTREAGKYLDCADIFSCHAYLAPVVSEGKRFLAVPVLIILLIYMFIVTRHRKMRASAWKHIREEMKIQK